MDKSKLPRHKLEELRRKEDEIRAKEVYKEFVEAFDDSKAKVGKTFVRGEVVNADTDDKASVSKPRLYKPPTMIKQDNPLEAARRMAEEKAKKLMEEAAAKFRPQKPGKKKDEKPKSNLEAFKEELRRLQEERDERRKLRQQLQEHFGVDKEPLLDKIAPSLDNPYLGNYDSDPLTTNLFMSNLNPKMSEEDVCRVFGQFGPLASVKIMWPRSDDERVRGYLTGFVAFMTRKDADRAVAHLKGKDISGFDMKLSWGKPVPIPQHPIYVPPRMLQMTLPPPPSGLPFNAQARKEDRQAFESKWQIPPSGGPPILETDKREAWEKMIKNAIVRVVVPTERPLLCLIHRMIEFVVREGPMFEAMIMSKELNNPMFRFLFDNQSPAHVYYRWKLFSILQGDSATKWQTKEFRMFENGSIWRPPPVNFYHQGLPVELYEEDELVDKESRSVPGSSNGDGEFIAPSGPGLVSTAQEKHSKKSSLTDTQRKKFAEILSELTPEREKIADAMLYCVEHADGAEEIVSMIEDGIADPDISLPRKIARLYLITDILANCAAKIMNVSYYRKFFENRLEPIFQHLHAAYARIDARLKAEQVKQRVIACCRIWEDTAVYTTDFLIKLQNIFLGLTVVVPEQVQKQLEGDSVAIEGIPLDDEHRKQSTSQSTKSAFSKPLVDYDLDGVPLEDEEAVGDNSSKRIPIKSHADNKPDENAAAIETTKAMFVRSKWETVDPEVVESQFLTVSKWEELERNEKTKATTEAVGTGYSYDDLDGIPMDDDTPALVESALNLSSTPKFESNQNASLKNEMSEEKRMLLREIEVKVVKYQDELEAGQRCKSRKVDVEEEVERYRQKLLKKMDEKFTNLSSSRRSDESKHKTSSSHSERATKRGSCSPVKTKGEQEKKKEKETRKRHKSRSRSRSRSADTRRSKHGKRSRSRSSSSRHKKKKH